MGGPEQQFCLRWNNHQSTLVSVFEALLESETLVDVTLAAEGRYLKAHKVVLCACSPFFQDVLSNHLEKYPIIVLKDVTFQELKALIDYMYRGEVNVSQEQLAALIKTAESLKIKGLADGSKNKPSSSSSTPAPSSSPAPPPPPPPLPPIESPVNNMTREGSASPISRKRRKRSRRRSGDSIEPESVESSLSEPPLDEETNKERVIRALGLVPPSALLTRTSAAAPGLMEPKVEDIDEESVDLMLDEDEDAKSTGEVRPGPSHEGIQAAAGFPPWHVERGATSGGDDVSISAVGDSSQHENRVEDDAMWDIEEFRPSHEQDADHPGAGAAPLFYVCNDCGRSYQRQRSLQRHKKYECGVEKRFTCGICWKTFKRPDQLHKHERTHRIESHNNF